VKTHVGGRFIILFVALLVVLSVSGIGVAIDCRLFEMDFWDWVHCVQQRWTYQLDRPGELCSNPYVTYGTLTGDCDDFAVMVCWAAERRGMPITYIQSIYYPELDAYHMVAFIPVDRGKLYSLRDYCGSVSYLEADWPLTEGGTLTAADFLWVPVDWQLCPDWSWETIEAGELLHWEDMVGKPY